MMKKRKFKTDVSSLSSMMTVFTLFIFKMIWNAQKKLFTLK